MSNSPFDPFQPIYPLPPKPPEPDVARPSLADLLLNYQPQPQPKPLDLSRLFDSLPPIVIRRRIFISYQHTSDQAYYNQFSRVFHDGYEHIFDNSLERRIDSDNTDYVIQRIRDNHIDRTSCTIVLVGPTAYQRKYLDWEIKATLDRGHGLIGIQLPNVPINPNNTVTVPDRLFTNIRSGYAVWLNWNNLVEDPATLAQAIEAALARDKKLIINPKDIKKQNG